MIRRFAVILLVLFAPARSCAQLIDLDGRPFDCDSAYTNYEMGWCARHLLDSVTTSMHALVDRLHRGLEREVAEWREEAEHGKDADMRGAAKGQVDFLLQARAHLDSAQAAFEQYARHQSALVGDLYGFGRERTIAEILTAHGLVVSRNEELEFLLERYDLR